MKSYWREIEEMGWGKSSVNYEALSREFHTKWGKPKMQEVRKFVGEKVGELYVRCNEWKKKTNARLDIGSDDGFNDVLYHIVGLGEAAFWLAMANPRLIEKRYNSTHRNKEGYTESFAYAFHEPENSKPVPPPVKPSKSAMHMMMLQRFSDKFAGESKETLINRLGEYYSNMPLPDLTALYKETFKP